MEDTKKYIFLFFALIIAVFASNKIYHKIRGPAKQPLNVDLAEPEDIGSNRVTTKKENRERKTDASNGGATFNQSQSYKNEIQNIKKGGNALIQGLTNGLDQTSSGQDYSQRLEFLEAADQLPSIDPELAPRLIQEMNSYSIPNDEIIDPNSHERTYKDDTILLIKTSYSLYLKTHPDATSALTETAALLRKNNDSTLRPMIIYQFQQHFPELKAESAVLE